MFYYYYEDITRVVRGYPKVHFRHLITPISDLGGGYVPIFDGIEQTQKFIDRGYEDTEIALKYYFEKYPQHSLNGTDDKEHPKVQSSSKKYSDEQSGHPGGFKFDFDHIRETIAKEDAEKKQEAL